MGQGIKTFMGSGDGSKLMLVPQDKLAEDLEEESYQKLVRLNRAIFMVYDTMFDFYRYLQKPWSAERAGLVQSSMDDFAGAVEAAEVLFENPEEYAELNRLVQEMKDCGAWDEVKQLVEEGLTLKATPDPMPA